MLSPVLVKYGFRIRTRVGLVVDNLLIHGRDQAEAQRKLRQMYRDCEIIQCTCHPGGARAGGVRAPVPNYEDVVDLITR
jgi:hypothetical protein